MLAAVISACGNAESARTSPGNVALILKTETNPFVVTIKQAAGNPAIVVSVDGGCDPGMTLVSTGAIGATALQNPAKMATDGVEAVAAYLTDATRPTPNQGMARCWGGTG